MLTEWAPSYYKHFKCIADRCCHSCCKGWEVDVDSNTLRLYREMKGELGERIRAALVEDDEGAHIAMQGPEERCPFLNEQGLCDIIAERGHSDVSYICRHHPRFYVDWWDGDDVGLGLCCEEAARLVLTWPDKVELDVNGFDQGGNDEPVEEEEEVRAFRDELIAMAQDRSQPVAQRMQTLTEQCGCGWPSGSPVVWAMELLKLERLDEAWTAKLERLKTELVPDMDLEPWAVPLEQLMVYLLYRHIPEALEDGQYVAHLLVCCVMWQTVVWMLAQSGQTMAELIDIVRMMSGELEYSQENMDGLLELFI